MFTRMLRCASCGASNRIPAAHLTDTGRCGSCKKVLPPSSEPIDADELSFDEIIHAAKMPVLVDFWASWCGPCRLAAPEVYQLAKDVAGRALVVKVDADACPQLMSRYRIRSIPNFIVFLGGKPVLQRAGTAPRAEMRDWVESVEAAAAGK